MRLYQIPFTGLQRQYNQLREEVLAVTDRVLSSGQLMNGPYTEEFEQWLVTMNQIEYAITCHSGTQALEIIAEYWLEEKITQPVVLMPATTYVATANAFIRAGWEVHFIDTNRYGILDTTKIPHDLQYDAVVLVGLYGASIIDAIDLRQWGEWIGKGVIVIEDAAQHWLSNNCIRTGACSAVSFDPMKNLSAYGNGGAILTEATGLSEFAKRWRNNGKPDHNQTGTNSRMSELDCAHMMIKTRYLEQWQQRRADISQQYIKRFRDSPVRCLIDDTNFDNHAHHKFVIEVDDRDLLQYTLKNLGIETKVHYEQPLHEMSVFRGYSGPNMLSAASSLSRRCLSLPIYPELTDSEVDVIADQVLNFFL